MKNIKGYTEHIMESAETPESLGRRIFSILSKSNRKFSIAKREEEVRRLIEAGADVRVKENRSGWTSLHYASRDTFRGGLTEIMRMLIDAGADVNAKNDLGSAPLHLTAKDSKAIALLISSGADVNQRDDHWGYTPLHAAASGVYLSHLNQHLKSIRMLIEAGADLEAKDKRGLTPLEEVMRNRDNPLLKDLLPIPKELILAGADISKAFDSIDDLKDFFEGDISWVPEEAMEKVRKRNRARGAFGRF